MGGGGGGGIHTFVLRLESQLSRAKSRGRRSSRKRIEGRKKKSRIWICSEWSKNSWVKAQEYKQVT